MHIVITGASSGIGAATARALAEAGRTLTLHGRNEAALADLAEEVRGLGATPHVVVADLTERDASERLAASLPDRIDVLIHSAGVVQLGTVAELDARDLDRQYEVNVRAPFTLTQRLLPALRTAEGLVVFVNSGAGLRANAGWSGYAASKFALKAIADALRQEEASAGVRVTSVYPGRTATPMQQEVRRQEGQPYDPDAFAPPEAIAAMIAQVVRTEPPATVPDVTVRPA
ncbi:MAG: SDR family oxidoreductase [Trueperaceae bacterium]